MKPTPLGLISLAAITTIGAAAVAAPRVVMFEQFTASWCGPCQAVGYALGDLTDNFPNEMQAIQKHIWSSAYGFDAAWCESRATFYGVSGIPHVMVDGALERIGSGGQNADYNALLSFLNQRLNVPTDVSIVLSGEPNGGNNYLVTMDISVDAGGPSRTMVIHLGHSVDSESGYPQSNIYYYDTHFDHMPTSTITLSGGQSTQLQHNFVLNGTAAANTDHVTFYCFAQEPGSNGSGNNLHIYNMGFLDYTIRPPKTFNIPGDFVTIQDALDNSINGDTLRVAAGTYVENLEFNGVSCTLESVSGPESTIIDGGASGTVIEMMGGGNATIDGFTIQNGLAASGSAFRITGSPSIDGCIVKDNVATSNYVVLSIGTPTFSNTLFCNNDPNNVYGLVDGGGNEFEDNCPDDNPCPADLDGDGVIDVNDVLYLLNAWGTPDGDIDGDGSTNVNDILALLSVYGNPC